MTTAIQLAMARAKALPLAAPSTTRPTRAAQQPAPMARAPGIDVTAAIAEAVRKDRARIRSILDAPEAVGRERSARLLALSSDDDVASVRRLLGTLQLEAEATDAEVDQAVKQIVAFARSRTGVHTAPP